MAVVSFVLYHDYLFFLACLARFTRFLLNNTFHPPMPVKNMQYYSCRCPLTPGVSPHVSSATFQWLEACRLTALTVIAKVLPGPDASPRDCLDRFT